MDILTKVQIYNIQKTGRTNMFDKNVVKGIAYEMGFNDLVCFIEESPKEYFEFILSGDEEGKI